MLKYTKGTEKTRCYWYCVTVGINATGAWVKLVRRCVWPHMFLWICKGLFRLSWDNISLWNTQPLQDSSGCAVPDSSMTQVATGPTHNATVLHTGVEVGGFPSAGLFGRKRLHGGEDEGKAVRNILIWGTGQSRCVSCRRLTRGKKHLCLAGHEEFWYCFS